MAISYIKDVGPPLAKRIWKAAREKVLCKKGKTLKDQNELQDSELSGIDSKTEVETKKAKHQNIVKEKDEDDFMKYVQILFYYVQDASLFKIQLPSVAQQKPSFIEYILQFSPEAFVTLYLKTSDLCFTPEANALAKIWFSSLFGPCAMVFILILYLCQTCISQFCHRSSKMFRPRLVQIFLLVVLFSFQKLVIGAFTLVKCVDIETKTILYVQGDIECYTWWQRTIEAYILLNIIPSFLLLSHVPFYVQERRMSVRMFIVGCLLPIPVLAIYLFERLRKGIKKKLSANKTLESEQIEKISLENVTVVSEQIELQRALKSDEDWNQKVDEFFLKMIKHPECVDSDVSSGASVDTLGQKFSSSESDTDIGSEYSTDLIKFNQKDSKGLQKGTVSGHGKVSHKLKGEKLKVKNKFNNSREAITHTLLKDYRPLSVLSVQFTWLGIHKIYRVGLVACSTYVSDPWTRLCVMTAVLLVMTVATVFAKPYKNITTNKVAVLSYVCNICIAVVNVWKTGLVTYGCIINCKSHREMALLYMGKIEDVLLSYLPVVVFPAAFLAMAAQQCKRKEKQE